MRTDATPQTLSIRLMQALEDGADMPPEVSVWLHDGIARWTAGEATTLDAALGLKARGVSSPYGRYIQHVRDDALRKAFHCTEGTTTKARLADLRACIRAFDGRGVWLRYRDYREPPDHLAPIQRELFRAFKSGAAIPRSDAQLRRIVSRNPVF